MVCVSANVSIRWDSSRLLSKHTLLHDRLRWQQGMVLAENLCIPKRSTLLAGLMLWVKCVKSSTWLSNGPKSSLPTLQLVSIPLDHAYNKRNWATLRPMDSWAMQAAKCLPKRQLGEPYLSFAYYKIGHPIGSPPKEPMGHNICNF
ncbi:hypothetical protein VNO77_44398 [Canavalia gladiata]|uniref:Uncharacterized protein n=1 Tax=Canavalia gladiata TaxID=3824 RepID=A0AAN9JYX0_CANGL